MADPADESSARRPPAWPEIRARSIEGLRASIAFRAQSVEIKPVTDQVFPLPERKLLYITTRISPPGGWGRRQFVLTDADTRHGRTPRRVPVQLAYDPQAHRIVLDVTPAVRRDLAGAARVEVGYADDIDLELKRVLLAQLEQGANRGPMVADLWTTGRLRTTIDDPSLNEYQSQALAAMVRGGGWLVWGPPGTGKTKVIVEAVQYALRKGQTVLITSHTHVAVDNVIKDLADIEAVSRDPGAVIRVPPTDLGKVDDAVLQHRWLLIDKAAAVITRREERLLELQVADGRNKNHTDRSAMVEVVESLGDKDTELIERAVRADQAATQLTSEEVRHTAIAGSLTQLRERLKTLQRTISSADVQAGNVKQEVRAADEAETVSLQWQQATEQAVATTKQLAKELAARGSRHQQLRQQLDNRPPRLPWRRKALVANVSEAAAKLSEADTAWRLAESQAAKCNNSTVDAARRAGELRSRAQASATAAQHAYELRCEEAALKGGIADRSQELLALDEQISSLGVEAAVVPDAVHIVADARRDGILLLLEMRDQLNARVHRLDLELKELERQRARLDDEFAETKHRLLADAPVVGCTLVKLTTSTDLANRRFDIVIVDEAASAEVPQLIYAGSKADHGLALVGDFLQNAPITDVDDAVSVGQRELLPWQRDDIFTLLGITDRASADAHARCVALRLQYRYPSIIADVVNEFCYDGLLESHRISTPEDRDTIIFVDTAGRPDQGLKPSGQSQTHPLGLHLLMTLIDGFRAGRPVGFVCPYRAQADQASRLTRHLQPVVQCGTAHKFQGRQFPLVIVDLMQDAQRARWVAAADIRGDERAVSAAKLLNVAITRAQEQLILIGDWWFVRSADTPGMRAIAMLDGRENFRLISADDLLH